MTDPISPRPRVALLVDGDNLSHGHAGALITKSTKHGALIVKRVYANMTNHPGWDDAPGFKSVHSGKGKNATDLLLAVEAMSIMLTGQADILFIAPSDGDFSHLAHHLTKRGHQVIGLGEGQDPRCISRIPAPFFIRSVRRHRPWPQPRPANPTRRTPGATPWSRRRAISSPPNPVACPSPGFRPACPRTMPSRSA